MKKKMQVGRYLSKFKKKNLKGGDYSRDHFIIFKEFVSFFWQDIFANIMTKY